MVESLEIQWNTKSGQSEQELLYTVQKNVCVQLCKKQSYKYKTEAVVENKENMIFHDFSGAD